MFENYEVEDQLLEQTQMETGFQVKGISAAEQSNYSFSMSATPGERLTLVLTYDGNVYDAEIINNIENHIKRAVEQVAANENRKISEIDILSEQEKERYYMISTILLLIIQKTARSINCLKNRRNGRLNKLPSCLKKRSSLTEN